jgi:hypothetical protein
MRGYLPSVVHERNGDLVVDQHRLDPLTSHSIVTRTVIRGGTMRQTRFFTRLFTFPELRDWLLSAGFRAAAGYGEDGNPLTAQHRRLITVAELGGQAGKFWSCPLFLCQGPHAGAGGPQIGRDLV